MNKQPKCVYFMKTAQKIAGFLVLEIYLPSFSNTQFHLSGFGCGPYLL